MVSAVASRGYVYNSVARDSLLTYVADLRGMMKPVYPVLPRA